ncbi:MAG: diaminopimelate decarboxylase [Candidatus Promineifilaceae bacterium]
MFTYQNNTLFCEQTPLPDIAQKFGTPAYVYSQAIFTQNAQTYLQAVPAPHPANLLCYAVKANGNTSILRQLRKAGLGADVTSGGELFLATHAGIRPENIIYSGVGKTRDEIHTAVSLGIRAIHVETMQEVAVIAEESAQLDKVTRIGVRVNPNIAAETHPAISTGQKAHKFGVEPETAVAILQQAHSHPHLEPHALATHIGSQITELAPYRTAAHFLVEIAEEMRTAGIPLAYLDVGGGLGIEYHEALQPLSIHARRIHEWVTAVSSPILQAGYGIVMEPGRSIIGPAGALLTRVTAVKLQGGKQFVITDAGMSDLIRPTLYDAYHPIVPVVKNASEDGQLVDVVGPICETGDFLAKNRMLPPVQPGDLLAVLQVGAYGYAMSSNYNGRLRPVEVLVNGRQKTVIRARQTFADLL